MKTAISLPDSLFEEAEKLARRLRISRSELFQRALTRFIEHHSSDVIRENLDRVYGKKTNRDLDPLIKTASEQSLIDEDW